MLRRNDFTKKLKEARASQKSYKKFVETEEKQNE